MASTPEQQRHWAIRNYGISVDLYNRILANQNGLCWICKKPPKIGKVLNIDHCHATQKVRGLLCSLCNHGLGFFRDNPEFLARALIYLQNAPVHDELKLHYEQKNKLNPDAWDSEYLKAKELLKTLYQLTFGKNYYSEDEPDEEILMLLNVNLIQKEIKDNLEKFNNS